MARQAIVIMEDAVARLGERDRQLIEDDPGILDSVLRFGCEHVRLSRAVDASAERAIEHAVGRAFARESVGDRLATMENAVVGLREKLLPSRDKGSAGERIVHDLLARHFTEARLEICGDSKRAHSGDILVHFPGATEPVLVEIKAWDRSCPDAEVEKCYNDMRDREATFGVMVGLKAGFAHRPNDFTVERRDGRTLVLVARAGENLCTVVCAVELARELLMARGGDAGDRLETRQLEAVREEVETLAEDQRAADDIARSARKIVEQAVEHVEMASLRLKQSLQRRITRIRAALEGRT